MKVKIEEINDFLPCTKIFIYAEGENLLASEIFTGVGLRKSAPLLRKVVLECLHKAGYIFGNELDDLAHKFQSTADVVSDDTYKITDLLNYTMEDFLYGVAPAMYFKRISCPGIHSGLYRQLTSQEERECGFWPVPKSGR